MRADVDEQPGQGSAALKMGLTVVTVPAQPAQICNQSTRASAIKALVTGGKSPGLASPGTARNPHPLSSMRILGIVVVAVWLAAVAAGLALVAAYDNRPGEGADASSSWPEASRLTRTTGLPTLVMVVHPRCDCSRASVAELAELMARATVRPRAYVAILKPNGLPADWDVTGIRKAAARIAGVTVIRDDDGREARAFGAATSGQTYLYDADGHLLFSGGITASRGHTGESVGRTAILAMLDQQPGSIPTSSVFGCSLTSPANQRWSDPVTYAHVQ
jgi:hypothetical protein